MKFKQQILLKHKHGITAQWISDDYNSMAIATYMQIEIKTKDVNGENVVVKRWCLTNCSGPWTGVSEDGKSLVINPGFEEGRSKIAGDADILLTAFNAYIGGPAVIKSYWSGALHGIVDDPDMFPND